MTAHSLFIWNTFTFLRLMQFPWRLLQFAVLGSALFFLFALKNLPNQSMVKKILLIVAIMWISWVSVNWTQPISYISNSDHDWLEYGKLGDASGEFLPKNFDQHKNYTLAEQVVAGQIDDTQQQFFNNSDAQVEILSWNGTKKTYSVELQTESTIVEKTMYFPGRKVLVDGQHISIDSDNQLYPGRVVFSLPAGAHSIESIWTEDTLDRKVGNLLSVSGFLIILILAGLSVKERIKKRTDLFSINS